MSAQSNHAVLVISADGFEDSELLEPVNALKKEGASVDVASLQRGTIRGKRGAEVEAALAVDEVPPERYTLLLLPGGKAPAALRDNDAVQHLVHHFFDKHKPVSAICHGPQILLSAGVLPGRTLTSYHSVGEELQEAGLDYVDRPVVVDDNLVTSRMPDDLPVFIEETIKKLRGADA